MPQNVQKSRYKMYKPVKLIFRDDSIIKLETGIYSLYLVDCGDILGKIAILNGYKINIF